MGTIDQVKERLDIVEIITESGVSLRKSGRSLMGFCPFHPNTRTPAFTVYPDSQSFYCFGCQASGTVIDYVMRKQGLDFREALEQLAQRAGVELRPRTSDEVQLDQQRTRLLALNTLAARYYNWVLHERAEAAHARAYLDERAMHAAARETFQLGYSPPSGARLLHFLTERKDYTVAEVEAAGLAFSRDDGSPRDRFRGRLMFPIRNVKGDVVGFGGRALGDMQPKYLNTPQTVLFDKSKVLYGIDQAREAIRVADAAVLVEGYVDVITAHQHGFRNVVAPLGTALTTEHVALLKKLAPRLYLALDADAAGQRATLKGLNNLLPAAADDPDARPVVTAQGLVRWQRDLDVRIITMPPGRDPDDVIKADPQQWQHLIDAARPVMDFLVDIATADLDLQHPDAQQTALERLVPFIRELDSTAQRVYITRLEHLTGMRADLLTDLIRATPRTATPPRQQRVPRPAAPPEPPPEATAAPEPSPVPHSRAVARHENYLMALLLRYPAAREPLPLLLRFDATRFPLLAARATVTVADLLSRTENRVLYAAWQAAGHPPLQPPIPALVTPDEWQVPPWADALATEVQHHLHTLAHYAIPEHTTFRASRDAEQCARSLRLEQIRLWRRRLAERLQHTAPDEVGADEWALADELDDYLAWMNQPRRSRNWTDLRDTTAPFAAREDNDPPAG